MKEATIASLLLAFLPLGAAEPAGAPVQVGAVTSLTGRWATFGKMQKAGFAVAIQEVNAKGGVLKRPLDVVLEDDGSDVNKALAAGEKLVNQKVPLIIGAYASGTTKPLAQFLARQKMPLLAATAIDEAITKPGSPYVFRINNASSAYSEAFFDLFGSLKDVKSVAVLTSNDSFGKSVFNDVTAQTKARNVKLVAPETYDQGLTDFRPILNRFKSLSPDVVIFASYESDAVAIARQAKEVGLKPRFLAGAATGFALPSFAKDAGSAAEGFLVSVIWSPDVKYEGAKELHARLKAELGGEEPSQHAAQSYAAVLAAADAINRAGSLDPEKVREALKTTRLATGFGPVVFSDQKGYQNQNPIRSLVTQVQNGSAVVVFPGSLASAKLK